MSTQMATGDIMSARVWSTAGPQAAVNTYNFVVTSTTGAAQTDQQLADALDVFFAAFYLLILGNGANYNGTQIYFLKRGAPGVLPAPVKATAGAASGSGGADIVPKNTAGIMKYSTGGRGPGSRGRVFLPFIATAFMDPLGDPDTGLNTLINGFGTNLLLGVSIGTTPDTAQLKWCLVHRTLPPVVTISQVILLNAESANKFGQLHKRGDYGRPNVSPI